MTVTRLYHPNPIETGQTVQLDKKASHHLLRVMRNRIGAPVTLFNGDGHEYLSILLDENPKNCSVQIQDKISTLRESPLHITLLQGISRGDRMDLCIQKSVELGVSTIIPVECERSNTKLANDRLTKKIAHWSQVIISACEQSGRCMLPALQPVAAYNHIVTSINVDKKFVLDPTSTSGLKNHASGGDTICILAGPEGGLSQNEISLARDNAFQAVHLGPRILRTETAGPACISAIQTLWGDLG